MTNKSKERFMKSKYVRVILYGYTNIETLKEEINDIILKKALASMQDFSPCNEQCEKIIDYIGQKVLLSELKSKVKVVFRGLTELELDLLDYKYFKLKPKEHFKNIDTESRSYFRRQTNIIHKLSELFEKILLTDEWFENNCLKINYFRHMLKQIEYQDKRFSQRKNLGKTNKERCKANTRKKGSFKKKTIDEKENFKLIA